GYAFAGWYENAEFTGEPVTAIAAASVGEKEYFAKWSKEAVYVSVTVVQAEHGAISVNTGAQSEIGAKVTVTAVPEEGYKLTAITVNGVLLEGNEFVLAQDVVITAEFSRNELMYAVSVQQCEHGVIVTDKKYAFENEIVTVTATPESGYKLKAIYVNGRQIDGNTFVTEKESVVTAEFEADTENAKSGGCKASAPFGVLPVLLCAAGALKKRRKK
ncbi:MAG: hypothetical protein ACI4SH_03905, partial [Candidatus Scatosoma sp.]